MPKINRMTFIRDKATWLMTAALVALGGVAATASHRALAQTTSAGSSSNQLLEKHAALKDALASNVYARPLFIESSESGDLVSGNAYAILDAPFSAVSSSFRNAGNWCDVMILHINTKYCRASTGSNPAVLKVHVGKKTPQTLQESFPLEFTMRQVATSASLMVVQLDSEKGPMGTSNYRIELQAAPLEGNKTFMHLRYSYEYGLAGKLAMQGYLATAGRGKVGFSTKAPTVTAPADANAMANYVGGARGAVERNTMRYYLAIDAYLQSLPLPAGQQVNARLEKWFDATEQYPVQLKETDKASYLTMKKSEIQRQQTSQPAS
jgi:hypothetical protein